MMDKSRVACGIWGWDWQPYTAYCSRGRTAQPMRTSQKQLIVTRHELYPSATCVNVNTNLIYGENYSRIILIIHSLRWHKKWLLRPAYCCELKI